MIFPDEVRLLCGTEPDAGVYSDTPQGLHDLGFWKLKPETLAHLKEHFDGTEYRALPVLERQGLRSLRVPREKLEISMDSWERLERQCNLLRQKFHTEFR